MAVFAQQPRAVTQVVPERFNETERVHVVDLLADARRVAEFAIRGTTRTVWRHAACDVVGNFFGQIGFELPRALLVPETAPEETRDTHDATQRRGEESD